MIIRINGQLPDPVKDAIVYGKDPVRDWFVNFLGEKATSIVVDPLSHLLSLLNTYSVEIIVIGVVACAFGAMIAPFIGSETSKWWGRLIGVMVIGSIWRMLI